MRGTCGCAVYCQPQQHRQQLLTCACVALYLHGLPVLLLFESTACKTSTTQSSASSLVCHATRPCCATPQAYIQYSQLTAAECDFTVCMQEDHLQDKVKLTTLVLGCMGHGVRCS
jgi:hypothetical protein